MKVLDFSGCKTNAEVCSLVTERMKEISYPDLVKRVSEEMVFQNKAVKAIYTGLSMNMNVFLSGKAGFGKSEIIKLVLNIYKIPYHTLIGYKDMPVDALLGIPDMDKLLKHSEYEINFEKSLFKQPGILIAEEFTHVRPETAAVLKDILTERGFRSKTGKSESLVSTMIIAANKSYSDMSIDESTKALYDDRFPIREVVDWEDYSARYYRALLKIIFKDKDSRALFFMAKLFEHNYVKEGVIISPRKAIAITKVFLVHGLSFIGNMGINIDSILDIKKMSDSEMNKQNFSSTIDGVIKHLQELTDPKELYLQGMHALIKLEGLKVGNENVQKITEAITTVKAMLDSKTVSSKVDSKTIDDLINNLE